ncbi:MAG: 1-acyl-sn-glycerol-3-phosphate acyltransferase [Planctomycetes bacterium]|nr:1-acyl-sn-glycerol-3-phosphate acyltransferase [Planctomycetota bacterium]
MTPQPPAASAPPPPPERTRAERVWLACFRALLWLFFREIEVEGEEHIPRDRGGLLVSWHPNGMIDPGILLTSFPRRVVFGARADLYRWPLLGTAMRAIGTVPIHHVALRPNADPEERRRANRASLECLAREVGRGSFAALFPEGQSHDASHPVEIKTGAARLYYQGRELAPPGAPPPVIVPVGLFYVRKRLFRSRALVRFHPPMTLPPALDSAPCPGEPEATATERVRALTAEIERVLHEVVHATEDWELHYLLHRARTLIRAERAHRAGAEPGRPDMAETRLGFERLRTGYLARRASHPDEVAALRARLERYHAELRALRLGDHELDRDPRLGSPWLPALLLLQLLFVLILLPPLLLVGYVVNGPTALAILALTRWTARHKKDEATIKLLVGALAFPLTWVGAGVLGALAHRRLHALFPSIPGDPWLAGGLVVVLSLLGGAVAVGYFEAASRTLRGLRVRLTRFSRRAAIVRLRAERAALCDAIVGLGAGLELPGAVAADGSVTADDGV